VEVLCLLVLLCESGFVLARVSRLGLSNRRVVDNGCYKQVQSLSTEEPMDQVGG